MSEVQRWLWIADVACETGSLVFIWEGTQGIQPVLMPGHIFYWWLDDSAYVQQDPEGRSGRDGASRWSN